VHARTSSSGRRLILNLFLRAALTASLGGTVAACAGSDSGGRPAPASTAVTGLRATLRDDERRVQGRLVWTTRWELCWRPVRSARAYVVTTVTAEGVSPRPRVTTERCFALDVAKGVARRHGDRAGKAGQLSTISAMLSVSVAARFAGGTMGPPSPGVPVGEPYP
jgi:hypothetical protein